MFQFIRKSIREQVFHTNKLVDVGAMTGATRESDKRLKINIKGRELVCWLGSGCGSVGRAVASNTRGLRFETSHWQNLLNICLLSTVLKRRK